MRMITPFFRYCFVSSLVVVAGALTGGNFVTAQELPDDLVTTEPGAEVATEGLGEGELPDPEQAREEAEAAMEAREFDKAFAAYTRLQQWGGAQENALTLEGRTAVYESIVGRGRALAGMQDYEAALEEFKKITDSDETYLPVYVARGELFLEMGQVGDALEDYKKALEINRARGEAPNMEVYFGLGKTYALGQAYPQAIRPLTRVIEAQPDNDEAYRLRGTSLVSSFQSEKGLADLQQAVSINPDDHENHFMLGVGYLRDEQHGEAVESFGRAISNYVPKPGDEDQPYLQGYLLRASTYIEQGKKADDPAAKREAYQKALADCEYLLDELDDRSPLTAGARASVLFSRGVAERMLEDYGKAIKSFSDAINLNPELSEAYFRRGICFHNIGETKMAIADFAQAGDLQFEDPRANFWEGLMYAEMGDYHEALRAYGDALTASDRYEPAYYNRGLAYLMLGENAKAIRDFNHAIRLEPSRAKYYFQRGVAQRRMGDPEAASNSFANAIEFEDNYAAAYRHMADVMQEMGRAELAREYREKADALTPAPEQQSAQ